MGTRQPHRSSEQQPSAWFRLDGSRVHAFTRNKSHAESVEINMAVIALEQLEVRLGGRVLLDTLHRTLNGRAVGFLGPNGSGKSTLINTLLGFHEPFHGTALVFDRDIRQHSREIRGLIGYMPENDSFIGKMSGIHFVRYMA